MRFRPGEEVEARLFLESATRVGSLRTAVSSRALQAIVPTILAFSIGSALALFPLPSAERWSFAPTIAVVVAIAVASLVFVHLYTGYFVIDPDKAQVRIGKHAIPFSDLKLPRVTVGTHMERAGEFAEYERESRGFVIECGRWTFFQAAQKSRKQIERVANALNEALREYDEREATREWLEGRKSGR